MHATAARRQTVPAASDASSESVQEGSSIAEALSCGVTAVELRLQLLATRIEERQLTDATCGETLFGDSEARC